MVGNYARERVPYLFSRYFWTIKPVLRMRYEIIHGDNMAAQLNRVHHLNFLDNSLPDACASLIIADPPYFEVKGEFDFIWPDFAAYLADVERWAIECKRILKPNGTLFWWGNSKKIAYSQVILDKYFNLENSLVWRKIDSMQYQYYSPAQARTFNTHTERLLMYSFGSDHYRLYFKFLHGIIGKSAASIKMDIGEDADHCFRHSSSQFELPQQETYDKIISFYGIENHLGVLAYEEIRRPFSNPLKYEEVLEFSQESHKTKEFDHDTCKPPRLTSMLVNVCTRRGDLVVVPFAGSGTECAMAADNGRPFVGFEIDAKHVKTSNDRCSAYLQQPKLF